MSPVQISRNLCEQFSYPDSIFVKSNTPSVDTVTTFAYICLDGGRLEIYVSDTSVALFGKGKSLRESIPESSNWGNV